MTVIATMLLIIPTSRADVLYSVQELGAYHPQVAPVGEGNLFGMNLLNINSGVVVTAPDTVLADLDAQIDPTLGLGHGVTGPRPSPDGEWRVATAFSLTSPNLPWVAYLSYGPDASPEVLAPSGPGNTFTAGFGVNDRGQAVGTMGGSSGVGQAVLFTSVNGALRIVPLGSLGGSNAAALGISDSGTIVGTSETLPFSPDRSDFHGFVEIGGKMEDLNELVPKSLGLTIITATAVNDLGQIAAIGQSLTDPNSYQELLLTPSDDPTVTGPPTLGNPVLAPEPTSIVGFGVIALAAGFRASRRRGSK